MSRNWTRQPERGNLLALRLIYWLGLALGRTIGRLLLYPITLYFLMTARKVRHASTRYLSRVLCHEPGFRHRFRHLFTFAVTMLDRVYLLAGQFTRFQVEIHGGDLVLKQIQSGHGCILLGSHLGSFEVLRVLSTAPTRIPVKVLMNIEHNQLITRFLNSINPEMAKDIIPIGHPDTLLKVRESLDQGCLIGLLGDRVIRDDKVVSVEFCGQKADFPAGPLLLAAILKCPVILFFGLYRGGRRYDIYFEYFAERIALQRRRRLADLSVFIQRYANSLERMARSAPYNWFNFYEFWGDADNG